MGEPKVKAEPTIGPVTDLDGFARCVELQVAVWGYSDGDVIPRRGFLLARHIGGQVLGAFQADTMIGVAMALPGYREGRSYLHSHMLAVLPEFRNTGIGRRLKLAQREDALARGFQLMEWTFDPLEIRNAYLNLHRLGAVARHYEPNFYGYTSSALQGGLPTDRLVAEWWLSSERVTRALAGQVAPVEPAERVTVHGAISRWKADSAQQQRALGEQSRVRDALAGAFARGLTATGFSRESDGGGSYLLTPASEAV